MDHQLGELRRVSVRDRWKNEARDFTPWLATEDNIVRLGDVVGLELEVESTEVAVGPYSADILARDVGSDRYVVIENQFGKTNHDHLGKLITYGSVLDASTIIWIAEEFTEEHRKALDWLNELAGEDLALFGVCLELWQIDTSRPAIRFNVVSRPELARTIARKQPENGFSDTRKLQLHFWTQFAERLVEAKVVNKAQSPRPRYWFNVPIGRAGIHLSNFADTQGKRVGVRLYIKKKASSAFDALYADRGEIEKQIGENLNWRQDQEDKTITVCFPNADLAKKDEWPKYLDWMVDMTRRFKDVLGPRVKLLDFSGALQADELSASGDQPSPPPDSAVIST